jgi:hypothetical protein
MSKSNLDIFRQHLGKALDMTQVYANSGESRPDSAIYLVDAGIFQILPKK